MGTTTDPSGNIYVADSGNNLIRKITPGGVVSTLAGSGTSTSTLSCYGTSSTCGDGTGSAATFNSPQGIVYDGVSQSLYVSDVGSSVVRKVTLGGVVTTFAGVPGTIGQLDGPYGTLTPSSYNAGAITVDGGGHVWVAQGYNPQAASSANALRMITPTPGGVTPSNITTVAGIGGWPYLGEPTPCSGQSNAGCKKTVGFADGTGLAAVFGTIAAIAFDSTTQTIVVADAGNGAIRRVTLPVIATLSPDGITPAVFATSSVVSTYAGASAPILPLMPAPAGCTGGSGCTLYGGTIGNNVAGTGNGRFGNGLSTSYTYTWNSLVACTNPLTVDVTTSPTGGSATTTMCGAVQQTPATWSTTFNGLLGITVDASGNVDVADAQPLGSGGATQGAVIWQITPAGAITQLAGGATAFADGMGSAAGLLNPVGLSADSAGNVYLADILSSNGSVNTVRKVTPQGAVTTIAGVVGFGATDATAGLARFSGNLGGLATDASGNVFVADTGNLTLRAITPLGAVTTLAGTAGQSSYNLACFGDGVTATCGDGTGAAASFANPTGVAFDSHSGNLFVADAQTIRAVSPSGAVSTYAGLSGSSLGTLDGTGPAASFTNAWGIAADGVGNLYVTDASDGVVRKIAAGGVVGTLAGTIGGGQGSISGKYCDTADVTNTATTGCSGVTFNNPTGIGVDGTGNVYVADSGDSVVRKIDAAGNVTTLAGTAGGGVGSISAKYCDTVDVTNTTTTGCTGVTFGSGLQGVAVDASGNVFVIDNGNNAIRQITPAGVVSTVTVQPGTGAGLPVTLNNPQGAAILGNTLFLTSGAAVVSVANVP